MQKKILFILFCFNLSSYSMAYEGIKTVKSKLSVGAAYTKVEEKIKSLGFTVFAKIDHQANAKKAGLKLAENIVVIFGKAKAGTKLMQETPNIGFDLPLKIQIFESTGGSTINYLDADYLKKKYQIKNESMILTKVENVLAKISSHASK